MESKEAENSGRDGKLHTERGVDSGREIGRGLRVERWKRAEKAEQRGCGTD